MLDSHYLNGGLCQKSSDVDVLSIKKNLAQPNGYVIFALIQLS